MTTARPKAAQTSVQPAMRAALERLEAKHDLKPVVISNRASKGTRAETGRRSRPKAAQTSVQPAMRAALDRLKAKQDLIGKFLSSRQICQDLGGICLRTLSRL
jgi:hypothetical protein